MFCCLPGCFLPPSGNPILHTNSDPPTPDAVERTRFEVKVCLPFACRRWAKSLQCASRAFRQQIPLQVLTVGIKTPKDNWCLTRKCGS